MSIRSRIEFMKTVEKGTSVSYGRRYFISSKTNIASVSIGYADGISRRLTNKVSVLVNGKKYPVVGAICMDQLMINVGGRPACKVGDRVTLMGRDGGLEIPCWKISEMLGTIRMKYSVQFRKEFQEVIFMDNPEQYLLQVLHRTQAGLQDSLIPFHGSKMRRLTDRLEQAASLKDELQSLQRVSGFTKAAIFMEWMMERVARSGEDFSPDQFEVDATLLSDKLLRGILERAIRCTG